MDPTAASASSADSHAIIGEEADSWRTPEQAISRLAHDMRAGLAVISGFALTLRDRGERIRPEQRREALEAMVRRSQSLATLLEELVRAVRDGDGRAP